MMRTKESVICKTHNWLEPESFDFLGETYYRPCPDCARELHESREAEERAQEERKLQESIRRALDELSIGRRYKGQTFADYEEVSEAAARIKRFCERYALTFEDRRKEGDSILMVGGCGTGKNMLAAIICQEVIKKNFSAVHTSVVKMVRRVKESWGKNSDETESRAIRNFVNPCLLVIDEVGVQFGSETERLYLTEIINDRYEARKPTILISNLPLKDLEGVVGERVIDRFHEGKGGVLTFDWPSYRRQKQTKGEKK